MAHSRDPSSTVATALDTLLLQIRKSTQPTDYHRTCCCGSSNCGKSEQTQQVLESLETDLRQAAQIGHALLTRYDNYVLEAEEERDKMLSKMQNLEREKSRLETANTTVIEENRYLLDQLESLNTELTDSGHEIGNLNAALSSTQSQLDRFSSLSSYTSQLEAQVAAMETEQAQLQARFSDRDEQAQAALKSSRDSERKIMSMTHALEKVEKDYQEEQMRHQEVLKRLERRHKVQKELQRKVIDPTTSSPTTTRGHGSESVVSSFVKEILQDNANLQMGIIELREMLTGSNDEVQNLREQTMLSGTFSKAEDDQSLKADLSNGQNLDAPYHVHHHYHAASKKDNRKEAGLRRPKKKRYATSPGFRSPIAGAQTPHILQSPQLQASRAMSNVAILSQTSVSVPPIEDLPMHSSKSSRSSQDLPCKAPFSATGSLSSSYQEASIFDLNEDFGDLSRPTTPASTSLGSPKLPSRHSKQGSEISIRSFSAQSTFAHQQDVRTLLRTYDKTEEPRSPEDALFQLDHETILEEPEDEACQGIADNSHSQADLKPAKNRLYRASSAESIFSTLGANAPTLRTMPSQLLISSKPTFAHSMVSVEPITTSMDVTGKNSRAKLHDSSRYTKRLLDNGGFDNRRPGSSASSAMSSKQPTSIFGKTFGAWKVGKWGVAPVSSKSTAEKSLQTTLPDDRKPGISQDRRVAGRKDSQASTAQVEVAALDNALLQDALG